MAKLVVGALSLNPTHLLRDAACWRKKVKPSVDWVNRSFVKVGARLVHVTRRWYVNIASAFQLSRHYRILLAKSLAERRGR